ncbi:keratin, type I cytoskeletal 19-like [Dendropsophus ebraccatus]|uniref:keratin, type I cytoskeletal 19-like n=1 Tax=Dendropsophus ebraccatus TaxID=150705 RepID=UPI0038317893
MSYKGASIQEAHEGSQQISQISSAGSHDEYSSASRASAQKGGSRDATTGYHAEDAGSTYGGSTHSNMQRTYKSTESGVLGNNSMARHRGGSEVYSSGPTVTSHSVTTSSTTVSNRHGGSSTGYSTNTTTGSSGSYGNSSTNTNTSSTTSNRPTSGSSSGGNTSSSSTQRVSTSGSSSNAPRTGGGSYSGGFSSRSTGGFSSRSTGRQGYSSGFSGASACAGLVGFGGGSSGCGPRGGFSSGSQGGDSRIHAGEKELMQSLNNRLSAYMDSVRALEESNSELEAKIRNWYETHKPKHIDNSKYYNMIEDLKDQIINAAKDNNQLTVEVDNARLAADDFRVKYESEFNMRQSVESDIEGLRKVLDDLTLEKASLESQVENLTEEIAFNKKNHEEEMKALQGHSSDVTVQVDAAPGINILKVLNDIRSQYEDMAEENRRKAEEEYNQKIAELNNEIYYSSAELETGKSELAELRRTVQTMEIDLQSQLAMKCSLENALAETQTRYARQLAQIQEMVSNLEEQLAQVRAEMENESCEYNLLLDIKNRLENEIEMYRRLLDGEGGSSSGSGNASGGASGSGSSSSYNSSSNNTSNTSYNSGSSNNYNSGSSNNYNTSSSSGSSGSGYGTSSTEDSKKSRVVTTIIEDRVDGRIVSTKVDKVPQKA